MTESEYRPVLFPFNDESLDGIHRNHNHLFINAGSQQILNGLYSICLGSHL